MEPQAPELFFHSDQLLGPGLDDALPCLAFKWVLVVVQQEAGCASRWLVTQAQGGGSDGAAAQAGAVLYSWGFS